MRIFCIHFFIKSLATILDFLRRGRLRREKISNGEGGLLGQGKVGVGVGGERGGRYKLKYFIPLYLPHLLSTHSWQERNVDEEGGQER